jgi:hypothetical protein
MKSLRSFARRGPALMTIDIVDSKAGVSSRAEFARRCRREPVINFYQTFLAFQV